MKIEKIIQELETNSMIFEQKHKSQIYGDRRRKEVKDVRHISQQYLKSLKICNDIKWSTHDLKLPDIPAPLPKKMDFLINLNNDKQ